MVNSAEVRALEAGHMAPAAALLARAFCDNPAMLAILGSEDHAKRLHRLSAVLPGFVAAYARHGLARGVFVQGELVGAALLSPPGTYPQPMRMQWELTRAVVLHAGPREAVGFGFADVWLKRRHMQGPHHYLFMLGVDPEQQGHGYGSLLLRDLASRADADGLPCYLETDKLSSVRLYERHGYEVTAEAKLRPFGNLQVWFMQRPASSAANTPASRD
jgi:ribosomal protein S18 acetylase RimI-like enzyme